MEKLNQEYLELFLRLKEKQQVFLDQFLRLMEQTSRIPGTVSKTQGKTTRLPGSVSKTQGKATRHLELFQDSRKINKTFPDQFLDSWNSIKTPGTVSRLKENQQDFQISFLTHGTVSRHLELFSRLKEKQQDFQISF